MRVSDIAVVSGADQCELQARVECDALGEPFLLSYRFPASWERFVTAENGDPFVAALLLPAMVTGEPLEISAPVSTALLNSSPQIQSIYRCWDRTLSQVAVTAPMPDPASRRTGGQVGSFFSLGVDSFYTLLKNLHRHPKDADAIKHLLVVQGFDLSAEGRSADLFTEVLSNTRKVAEALGKECLPVTTNIRQFGDLFVDWGSLGHGAALASVGLALQGLFRRVSIASSCSYTDLFPWGSHLVLDPLWSTEQLSIVHDGCEAQRLERLRFISQFPIALDTLRVCWKNPDNQYNCGRCEKCLRTMVGLHIAGVLQDARTFPDNIEAERLRRLPISRMTLPFVLERVMNLAAAALP